MASRPLCDRSGRDRRGSIEHLSLHECARKNANRHALHAVRLPAFTRCPMESRPKGYACHKEASIIPRGTAPACALNVRPMLTCLRRDRRPSSSGDRGMATRCSMMPMRPMHGQKQPAPRFWRNQPIATMAAANSSAAIRKAMSGPSAPAGRKTDEPGGYSPEQNRRKQRHIALK